MGGGGRTTTSESGIPDWARPALQDALGRAVATEQAGGFSHVQGLTPEQITAMDRKAELGARGGVLDQIAADSYGAGQVMRDAASGEGKLFGAGALGEQAAALKGSIDQAQLGTGGRLMGDMSRQGALGSARARGAMDKALTEVGANMASQELANRRQYAMGGAQGTIGSGAQLQNQFMQGANVTQGVGDALQQQGQNEGDSNYQGQARLWSFFGSPALGQKQISQQKGK